MSKSRDRRLVSRTIEGVEALVSTESNNLFIDMPAASPRYIRVKEGEIVQEGDIRSQTEEELTSESLRKWTIETIGPKTIIGTDRETGDRREWERESLEHKLAIGGLSTNLTDFERVTVGKSNTSNPERQRSDKESVPVTVYGNDSRKFTQTYRLITDDTVDAERRLELMETDERVERFETDLRERFDQAVGLALRNEGYAV